MLTPDFFNQDACTLAKALLGKIIRRNVNGHLLAMRIIETEAYYLVDKASHASLGFTEKRKALFMPAGTIYMYYAHGKASLNVSANGAGNAVLIKSAHPYFDEQSPPATIDIMQQLHDNIRPVNKLGNGQTLLCKSLHLFVPDWDARSFQKDIFYMEDMGHKPNEIIVAQRLGIPLGRDEHLPYRFIDADFILHCTRRPKKLSKV